MPQKSAFFYGTLMHPKILKRVIGNDGSHLHICPAVLLKFTRHKVKFADYPGIIPYSEGQALFDSEPDRDACSVRGTMVTGLTKSDIALLDIFEGSEYTRDKVPVYPLSDLVNLADYTMSTATPAPLPPDEELPEPVRVETYVYGDISGLMRDIWSFDDFVEKNAWKWYGSGSRTNPDYTEVDRRQAAESQ
ncbi:hypothetical protein C8F04DRAFT_1100070 [Mycena alexandri]|uniref:Putative gamma-glutamylcyclotransferase n=1 Tax=Mycena alexandri TaxID=1745969 RepID=A0AAD6X4Y2_9AGAR|nr:hypothetical protein C8F04DRAFT_1100070 [Mycena alexandri]